MTHELTKHLEILRIPTVLIFLMCQYRRQVIKNPPLNDKKYE